jgi:hypothetical protein
MYDAQQTQVKTIHNLGGIRTRNSAVKQPQTYALDRAAAADCIILFYSITFYLRE